MEARKFTNQDILKDMQQVKQFKILEDDETLQMFSILVRNPDALTNEHIKFIGDAYLSKHPEKQGCLAGIFTPHTNHPFAKELKVGGASSTQDRWNFLINLYSKLPNTTGNLAMTLLYVFGWAFNKTYTTYDLKPTPFIGPQWTMLSSKEVAQQLMNSVNAHYASRYRLDKTT